MRHLQHLTFLTKIINSFQCVFWWLRRVGARGQEVPFLFWSQLLQRAALLTSAQLLPTLLRRESFLLSNSGGLLFRWSPRAITNIIGSPQLCYCRRWTLSSLCRNDSWTPISSSMRTYLHDNCLKPISFLLRFVRLFGLLLFKQLHAVGQKLITLSSLQNAETTPYLLSNRFLHDIIIVSKLEFDNNTKLY